MREVRGTVQAARMWAGLVVVVGAAEDDENIGEDGEAQSRQVRLSVGGRAIEHM